MIFSRTDSNHLAPNGKIGLVLANGALSTRPGGEGEIPAEPRLLNGFATEFNSELFSRLVDFYTVYGKDDVRATFKNGTEIKA